jgi:copper chaperone
MAYAGAPDSAFLQAGCWAILELLIYMRSNPMTTEQFRVPEISCQHCVNAITKEVTALAGVQKVQVDLGEKRVTVEHAPEVSTTQIVAAINEAGYDEVVHLS